MYRALTSEVDNLVIEFRKSPLSQEREQEKSTVSRRLYLLMLCVSIQQTHRKIYIRILLLICRTLVVRTQKIIFLFLNQNICCVYSKEQFF